MPLLWTEFVNCTDFIIELLLHCWSLYFLQLLVKSSVCTDATEGSSTVGGVVTSLTLDANGQYHFRTDTGQGNWHQQKLICLFRPGVGKVQPTGHIRPASSIDPARGGSSVFTLNPACVFPLNALKDEWLFSRWVEFSRTLIVDTDWLFYTRRHWLALLHFTRSVTDQVTLGLFWRSL